MAEKNLKSIVSTKTTIVVAIVIAGAMIFVYLFTGVYLKNQAKKESYKTAKLVSSEISNTVQLYFRDALIINKTLSENFLQYRQDKTPRYSVYKFLKGTILNNKKFLAIWTMWAPNAYDQKDKLFANDGMHDQKGTMAMAYYFDNDKLKYEVNDTLDFQEDFYTVPARQKKPLILDPFHYQYHGNPKSFFETSLVTPIIQDSVFQGVIGIDIDLYMLHEKYKDLKIYKSGFISILSNSGQIVSHPNIKYVDTNIDTILTNENKQVLDSFKRGKQFSLVTHSEFSKKEVLRVFYPVNIESMVAPWYIMVEIPVDEIFSYTNRIKYISLFILATILLLLLYIVYNIIERRNFESELIKYRDHLEDLVRERTLEIETLNEELRQSNEELLTTNDVLQQQKEELNNTLERLKDAQNQLVQSEKMAALGVLTAGVAHEINNPLNFISTSVLILNNTLKNIIEFFDHSKDINETNYKQKMASLDEMKQKINIDSNIANLPRVLSNLQTGVSRIVDIVKGLSLYSRSDDSQKISADIHENIETALLLLQNKIKNTIEIEKKYGNLPLINCFQGKITQVFVNLLSNAVDAISENTLGSKKGKIIISTYSIDNKIIISILDSGPGINNSIINRIFDPFFTTKPVGKGVGLGLSITQGIIENHKGSIIALNSPDGGAEFIIELPLN